MSLRMIRTAMMIDWPTSIPLMPATMLIELGQKMAMAAM